MNRLLSLPYKVCQVASGGRWSRLDSKGLAKADLLPRPKKSFHLAMAVGCALLVALVGYGDFREGDENTMLLFYMVPIALATWYSGMALGVVVVGLSITADLVSDWMAGVTTAASWNTGSSILYYVVFVVLLSRWHNLLRYMHLRVEERTADLQREIAVRRKLEREVANVAEHERRRLGRQLHDNLCQHLTGTALKAQTLVKQLGPSDDHAVENARGVVSLINGGIEIARDIARGLFSAALEGEGLIPALEGLADTASQEQEIDCSFHNHAKVSMSSENATHLYWIAREAVTNAIRHAQAKRIQIELAQVGSCVELSVEDDGIGMSDSAGTQTGIGLQVMRHRAELAGGFLETTGSEKRGTIIRCTIPLNS